MAGVAGFEPAHDGIKTRCLTAWLHPILSGRQLIIFASAARHYGAIVGCPIWRVKRRIPRLPEGPIIDDKSNFDVVVHRRQASGHRLTATIGILRDGHEPVALRQFTELAAFVKTGLRR